ANAPSVNQQECALLFEPLYRKDSARTRRNSGAGLGLSICRNIVAAHQGNIYAAPNTIGGLCITIQLPIIE
ncbi:ATP-binding protein, partial [Paraglaciecola sp.]|uniref:ATP-binding protein n=1 Tax=Paraglaciecola sp. TaxID=1920173 RepID=UPI00273DD3D1